MIYDRAFGIILIRDGKVLMTNRPKADGWDFPKGHVNEGESDLMGAMRELEEETGYILLQSKMKPFLFETIYEFQKESRVYFKQCYFRLAWAEKLEQTKTKHDDSDMERGMTSEWVPINEVESRLKFKPYKKLWKVVRPHVKS